MSNSATEKWIKRVHCTSVPPEHLSETMCPICGGEERRQLIEERGYPLWKCRDCTHVYISPRPSQQWLAELYRSAYMPDSDNENAWECYLDRIFEASSRAILRYHPARGDLLDVGAGFGGFLARAAKDGWRLHGLEPNASAFAVAKQRLGDDVELQQSLFEDAELQKESYEAIIMTNVIEHVREPIAICRRAFELLRPGGFLGLRWPQMSWLELKRLGRVPNGKTNRAVIGAPVHLHDFNRKSVELLFSNTGFTDVEHAWSGTRRYDKQSWRRAFLENLATRFAHGTHVLSRGRFITPFIARLSLGRKPR